MIKAVIFDFGRVISAQKPASLFRSFEKELGLEPDTINVKMFDSHAWQNALLGRITLDEFWRVIGPVLGLTTPEKIEDFRRRYHAHEAVNKEVLKIIHALTGHYKLAILSNAPSGLTRWLAEWRLYHLFDVVFCSGDEGVIKPDPLAFETTVKRLGVRPKQAVFIDDTIQHVEAAKRVGLHGIHFTTAEVLARDLKLCFSQNNISCNDLTI